MNSAEHDVYILTIARNLAKATSAQEQVRRAGVEASLFVGVDGEQGWGLRTGERVDPSLEVKVFGRRLSPLEIGCYLSHWRLWEQAYSAGLERIVVLEDDVRVPQHSGLPAVLAGIMRLPQAYEYIHLAPPRSSIEGVHPQYLDTGITVGGVLSVLPMVKPAYRTHGYALSRRGLGKLLSAEAGMMPMCKTVDMSISGLIYAGFLNGYLAEPPMLECAASGENVIKYTFWRDTKVTYSQMVMRPVSSARKILAKRRRAKFYKRLVQEEANYKECMMEHLFANVDDSA